MTDTLKLTAQDIYKNWRDIYAKHQKMGRTVLQLLAHPDAKPEDITRVREAWIDTTPTIRKVRESVLNVLRTKYSGFRVSMMITQIEEDKV